MAFGTMTSLLGMIPLLAIGMNYYRYQNVDPENKVQEPQVVRRMDIRIIFGRKYWSKIVQERSLELFVKSNATGDLL